MKRVLRVLIVENLSSVQEEWRRQLEEAGVRCIFVSDPRQAPRTLLAYHPIPGVDAVVWGNVANSSLQLRCRDIFSGPIVAAAANEGQRQRQMRAGCNYSVADRKYVPQKISALLGLVPA